MPFQISVTKTRQWQILSISNCFLLSMNEGNRRPPLDGARRYVPSTGLAATVEKSGSNSRGKTGSNQPKMRPQLEEEFNIELPQEEQLPFQTVQDVVTYVQRRTNGR
jgi:hypothetical protein